MAVTTDLIGRMIESAIDNLNEIGIDSGEETFHNVDDDTTIDRIEAISPEAGGSDYSNFTIDLTTGEVFTVRVTRTG